MMNKGIRLTVFFALLTFIGYSQTDYKNAIGVRVAPESYHDLFAFSYKTFITDAGALEFNAGAGSRRDNVYNRPFALSVSGTYQHHFKIPVQGLQWFVGGGLTAYNSFYSGKGHAAESRGFGFGFYPTGGIDWKIPNVPLSLTADYRPTIFVARTDARDSFEAALFGFAVRYTIGQR